MEYLKKIKVKTVNDLPKSKEKVWVKFNSYNRLYFSKPAKHWIADDIEFWLKLVTREEILAEVMPSDEKIRKMGEAQETIPSFNTFERGVMWFKHEIESNQE